MKQAISNPPIKPFMPPRPVHENHAQENLTAVVPCTRSVNATAATISSTAYWNTTMTHSKRATLFRPTIARAVISKFQAAPARKIAQ